VTPWPSIVVAGVGALLYVQKPGDYVVVPFWRARRTLAELGRCAFVAGLACLLYLASVGHPFQTHGNAMGLAGW
jgi:hypothetical protein